MNFKMVMICPHMKAFCGCTVFPFFGALNVEMNAEFFMPAPNDAQLYGTTL
jgi:hypothetical protein